MVGLTPNLHAYVRSPGRGPESRYVQSLAAVARKLLAMDLQVVVMPHLIAADGSRTDDRLLCRLIAQAVGIHPNLHVMLADATGARLKAAIGLMDLLVTSRYHTIIAAFSQRVPVAAVGWSHKYDDLFASVKLSDCQVSCKTASPEEIEALAVRCWQQRDRIKAALVEHVPALESASQEPLDRAVEILRRHMEAR